MIYTWIVMDECLLCMYQPDQLCMYYVNVNEFLSMCMYMRSVCLSVYEQGHRSDLEYL